MPDVYNLMGIAERANPPDRRDDDQCVVTMDAREGWTATFFYDCGGLDYIEYLTDPEGLIINPWSMECNPDKYGYLYDSLWRLGSWGSIGDSDRLRVLDAAC